MKIYHAVIPKTDKGLSGGETCMIALVKYLAKEKYKNVILTTTIGKETYGNSGLKEDGNFIKYYTFNFTDNDAKHHIFFRWVISLIRAIKSIHAINFLNDDIMICHSDFFPDYITAYFCKKKNPKIRIYYWYHMLAPSLFYGYEGEFTKKIQFPKLNVIFYQLNQWLFRFFIDKNDVIITVNKYYERILKKVFSNNRIYCLRHFGGSHSIRSRENEKKYDVIWIGRFHPQKGIFQFIDIVSRIALKLKSVKVVVIGGGDAKIKREFFSEISKKHLDTNITYIGPVVKTEEYLRYLNSSKVFLMTSLYEGFGLVNLDAMRQHLPVVAYDLPVYEPIKKAIITVPLLKNNVFSDKVVELLKDDKYYDEQSKKSYMQSLKFSWDKMGSEILSLIKGVNYV